jgi:hypothetical protein
LDLSRDNAGLLSRTLALERVPSRRLCGLFVLKDLLEGEIELAEVVLAEAILVPADDVKDQAVC